MVSITPRQRRHTRQGENVITSESWEKEELETGLRSWKTPSLDVLEDKIEARRLAKESRSTTSSNFGSAPGSSGKISSTDRSVSLNGSILSEAIDKNNGKDRKGKVKNGAMSADDTDTSR